LIEVLVIILVYCTKLIGVEVVLNYIIVIIIIIVVVVVV